MVQKVVVRFAVFVVLLLLLAGGGFWWWRDATSPLDPSNPTTKIFVISAGEGVRSIANRLKNEGIISSQIGFFLQVKVMHRDSELQAGDFRLSPAMDVKTIAETLTHGTLDIWVTTLEGWRVEEIALELAKDLSIPETEFLKFSREGYMFPDTYLIPKEASAAGVAKILTDNFDKRVTPELREGIAAAGLTIPEGIILASIVEREGKTTTDRPIIAGILIKRLKNDWPLQTDATIQYALGYQPLEKMWWKKVLTEEDKKIDSPYNTYKNKGLPPGPIANPGLLAISAVARPQESTYWYYLHDLKGEAHYGETVEEHNANISTYLSESGYVNTK